MEENLNEVKLHNHTIVALKGVFGTDAEIEEAARVSYGKDTRKVSDTRNLIRYLVRHKHTSPLEMAEVKFYLKIPIFVMRQLVRHRTANLNEYSARYSVMKDEFYLPDFAHMAPQSGTNKQGRDGEIPEKFKENINLLLEHEYERTSNIYHDLLGDDPESPMFGKVEGDEQYPGLSRELARIVMPVAAYTELYWKIDLHNFLHCMKLRLDPHAQLEIREIAEAMYNLVAPKFPIACEAFEDYIRNSKTLSRMDIILLRDYIDGSCGDAESYGMSKREYDEMIAWCNDNLR